MLTDNIKLILFLVAGLITSKAHGQPQHQLQRIDSIIRRLGDGDIGVPSWDTIYQLRNWKELSEELEGDFLDSVIRYKATAGVIDTIEDYIRDVDLNASFIKDMQSFGYEGQEIEGSFTHLTFQFKPVDTATTAIIDNIILRLSKSPVAVHRFMLRIHGISVNTLDNYFRKSQWKVAYSAEIYYDPKCSNGKSPRSYNCYSNGRFLIMLRYCDDYTGLFIQGVSE
jgi:hypothetical protein